MNGLRFFRGLAVTVGLAAAVCAVFHLTLPIDYALPLTIGSTVLLTAVCVGLYYGGRWAADHESKFMFNNVFLGGTMVKMFVWGGLLAAYIVLAGAPNKWFVLPAFAGYLIFTVYEIVFLMRLARGGLGELPGGGRNAG